PIDVDKTLREALKQLTAERAKIEKQIKIIAEALEVGGASVDVTLLPKSSFATRSSLIEAVSGKEPIELGTAPVRGPGRRKVSAAERAATSKRMKAYWAKRRKAKKK